MSLKMFAPQPQVQVSVSEMAGLLPLVQSYPAYCPYEVLLSSLNDCPLEECRSRLHTAQRAERELWLRPLRCAKGSLADDLQQFGLEICSLRGIGYLLKPSSVCPSSSQHVEGS